MQTQYVWQANYKKIIELYNDEELVQSNDEKEIRTKLKSIIKDPDAGDRLLYQKKADQLQMERTSSNTIDDKGIKLGLDCVCGWKQIFDFYHGKMEWIEMYKRIRSNLNAHLAWPRTRCSINTLRYTYFNDRVDYTLFDIKNYYENKKCILIRAYQNESTAKWLLQYGSFKEFIDRMQMKKFVIEKNGKYEIIDLDDTNMVLDSYSKEYLFSDTYMKNMLRILENENAYDYILE